MWRDVSKLNRWWWKAVVATGRERGSGVDDNISAVLQWWCLSCEGAAGSCAISYTDKRLKSLRQERGVESNIRDGLEKGRGGIEQRSGYGPVLMFWSRSRGLFQIDGNCAHGFSVGLAHAARIHQQHGQSGDTRASLALKIAE